MKTASIRDAKAHLNELVALAEKGEDVVLMRGSRIVACIRPASEDDYGSSYEVTDEQAERLDRRLDQHRRSGRIESFRSPEEAVRTLRRRFRKRASA